VAACTTPDDGDIVVREEGLEGTVVYVLHTVPRADQHLLRTREEAVSKALAFAKRRHVLRGLRTATTASCCSARSKKRRRNP